MLDGLGVNSTPRGAHGSPRGAHGSPAQRTRPSVHAPPERACPSRTCAPPHSSVPPSPSVRAFPPMRAPYFRATPHQAVRAPPSIRAPPSVVRAHHYSMSPSLTPCQPNVLPGGKRLKRFRACISFFTQTRPVPDRHFRPSVRHVRPYLTPSSPNPSSMTTLATNGSTFQALSNVSSPTLLY
jgi:hypothetical protein